MKYYDCLKELEKKYTCIRGGITFKGALEHICITLSYNFTSIDKRFEEKLEGSNIHLYYNYKSNEVVNIDVLIGFEYSETLSNELESILKIKDREIKINDIIK